MTQELRRLAEAATQGEWAFGSFHRLLVVPMRDGVPEKHDYIADLGETEIPWDRTSDSTERYNNAAYIAAANPAAILSLLDRLERAEKDAQRYRWLRDKADYLRLPDGSPQVLITDEFGEPISLGKDAYPQGNELDAAIDAAMEASK